MRRRLQICMALMLLLISLTACGQQAQPSNDTEQDNSQSSAAQGQTQKPNSDEPHIPTTYEQSYKSGSNQDWEYDLYDSGAVITGYIGDETVTELYIPGELEGKPVVYIEGRTRLEQLEHVVCPDSLIGIGGYIFEYCKNLNWVELNEGLEIIKSGAFTNCKSLEYIELPESLKSIGEFTFSDTGLYDIVIPANVTEMQQYGFSGCEQLTSITFLNQPISIPEYFFHNCTSLYYVNGLENVTGIETGAFNRCESLENIDLPNIVTINDRAFSNCKSLYYIDFPDSLSCIEECAFEYCTSLYNVYFPSGMTEIEESTFFKCEGLMDVYIPGNIKKIGQAAFGGCNNLWSITLEDGVETIGQNAFTGCSEYAEVYLPASVKSVYDTMPYGVTIYYDGDADALIANGSPTGDRHDYTILPMPDMSMNPEDFYMDGEEGVW